MPIRHGKYPIQAEYEVALENSVKRVRAGASQKSTTALFQLSCSILTRRVQGHQTHAEKIVAAVKLSRGQETELIGRIYAFEASGITASLIKERQLATQLPVASGADTRTGKYSVEGFVERRKDGINSMTPSLIEQARIDDANKHIIAPWFECLKGLIDTSTLFLQTSWPPRKRE